MRYMETLNQTYFRNNIKSCLDRVNDNDDTIYVTRPKNRAVAVISTKKLKKYEYLELLAKTKEGTTDHALARDKLIELGVLDDNDSVIDKDNWTEFWQQFKK